MKQRNNWLVVKEKLSRCTQIGVLGRSVLVLLCGTLGLFMFHRVHEDNKIDDNPFIAAQPSEDQVAMKGRKQKAEVQDGEEGRRGTPEKQGNGRSDGKINLNEADKELLMEIPYIGAKKADDIIAYRTQTPFVVVEDVMEVKGISQKTFDKIFEFITI